MSGFEITIQQTAPARWDDYVASHPDGSPYHLAAAAEIGRRAFNLDVYYAFATDAQQRLCGALPLIKQSSLAFGRFLISVPFFNYGGVLADSPQIAAGLMAAAQQLASDLNAKHFELRQRRELETNRYPVRTDKVTLLLDLPATTSELSKQLGSKLRSQIKRAERENPKVEIGGPELLPQFYSVFCEAMHELGTPVYPLRFFQEVFRALPERCRIVVVSDAVGPQAAGFLVQHADSTEVPWAAARATAKPRALNMRLYWEMLQLAVGNGSKHFDFGRSTVDSGTYRFKLQWGARPVQLHWYYWLAREGEVPKLNHSNPKYAMAASIWRKLPRWVVNAAGPYIIRNLP
jgi:serine/alanine adding enzyme